ELLPERIIRKDKVIPLSQSGNTLTVATADPLNVLMIDDLKALTGCNIQTIVATPSEIEQVVGDYYSTRATMNLDQLIAQSEKETETAVEVVTDEQSVDLDQLMREAEEAPIIRIANLILSRAIRERASDIHLEPLEKKVAIRYRIDGTLYPIITLPKRVQDAVVSRIKILSEMDIAEHRLPQDGRFRVRAHNRDVDFRFLEPFRLFDNLLWAFANFRSDSLRHLGLAISSSLESVAKFSSPTSMPTAF
ncbi:unnamed protein product, partial [marine sediment metagenome]